MKRLSILTLFSLLAVLVTGCIETDVVVHVSSDGSGKVVEIVTMSKMAMAMMSEMSGSLKSSFEGEGEEGAEADAMETAVDASLEFFTEEKVRAQAKDMGPGVRLLSYEPIDSNGKAGYRAVFAFDDINTLKVNQNPGSSLPETPGDEEEAPAENVMFSFTPGSPARLVVTLPQDESETEEAEEESEEEDSGNDLAGFEQMKEMFRGMRMAIAIEVDGSIKETNATYVDGSKVTLVDFDFDKIIDNPEAMEKLAATEEMSPTAAKDVLHAIPGVKFDIAEQITIVFD